MQNPIGDYISHGWSLVPIRPGSKGPTGAGWSTRHAALKSLADLPEIHGVPFGVGLMHAYSGTMAFDIDDWERTNARGIDVDALYAMPDAVTILSGRPGRGKLLYRMPFGLVLPTKRFQDPGRINVFELRCGTTEDTTAQDVLPPSIHPETGNPYAWGGAGHWTRLPAIPASLLTMWLEAVKDIRPARVDGVDSSWDEIKDALNHINPDCSRQDWINAGMALHWAGEQTFNSDQAFAIWDDWSRGGVKYPGERAIAQQWASFRTSKASTITLGTLFHVARENGWVRPVPDASTLFGAVGITTTPKDIIDSLRPKPPDMDLSLWPDVLRIRAGQVGDSVGCDPIVPLFAGLAAVCGAIDARSRLELMPGFQVPPVLWLMTLGDPADKKSPGSWPMLEPLAAIEAEDRQRFARAVREWEPKEAAWAAAKKAFLQFAGTPEALLPGGMEQAPTYPEKPTPPVPLKITVQDVTSQKLVHIASTCPRGLLCHLDEMSGWVNKITDKRSGEDRSAWVMSYESKRYEMDRVKDGSMHCENLAVAIYGNIQPTVFREHLSAMASDGLLQRFLPAVLRHDKTRLGHPIPDFLTNTVVYENMLRLTYALAPMTYKLAPEAFAVYRRFQEWYESQKGNERLIGSGDMFMTAFGKLEGLAGRLILLFHVIECPFSLVVNAGIVERVIKIIRGYVIPAYRHLFGDRGSMSEFDMWVTEHVIQHADASQLSITDIKRSARRPLERAKVEQSWLQNQWVINAMFPLEQAGWVARGDDGSQELRGIAHWLINPALKDTFSDYRKAVVAAKQALVAEAERIEPNYHYGFDLLATP